MRSNRRLYFVWVLLYAGMCASAQVKIRDHRKDKTVWVPHPQPTRPGPATGPDFQVIPPSIGRFAIDPQYRQEINLMKDNLLLTNSAYKVFFSNRIVLGNGELYAAATSPSKELLFYTDTLVIDGQSKFDLRNNSTGDNGFLMFSCRVLKVKSGAQLRVYLSTNYGLYRKFYLFAEQVILDDKKALDETNTISNALNSEIFRSGHWERLRVGEVQLKVTVNGVEARQGYKFIPHDPVHSLVASVGFLSTMQDTNVDFFNFFSRWVVASYQDINSKLSRNINAFDKMPAVKEFIRFIALNSYNQLENSYQNAATQLVERINGYRGEIFRNGFQFERTFLVSGRNVKLIGSVTENGIVYYLPPTFSLINASVVNGRSVSGYHVFDETQPNLSTIDFDVMLSTDSRLKTMIQAQYLGSDETVSNGFEEIQFNSISVQGPDVLPNQTKISTLSNNGFNIRMSVNNGSVLLFNRLFSHISSDIFLVGKWGNMNGSISGDMKVPLSFVKQYNPPIEMKKGTIHNKSTMPAIVEFYLKQKQVLEQSPALLIEPGASFANAYTGDDKEMNLPADAVSFKLNPEKFGDYFEQIDNSDKLTQELFLENHIAPTAMDSTGYLQSVELIVSYELGGKTYQKKIQLSSANTLGSCYLLVIPKSSKDPVSLTISGKALYENAEYDIVEVKLNNAEARFDLQEKMLKNK